MRIARIPLPIRVWATLGGMVVCACAVQPRTLAAQTDSAPVPTVNRGIFVRTGVFTLLATAALMPLDASIARQMQSARMHGGSPGTHAANVFNWLGGPGTVTAPFSMIVLGWTTRRHPLFDVGVHAAEAVGLGSGVTFLLKGIAGRARPTTGSIDPDDFSGGSGFGRESNSSFPSGHATASFALATALTMGAAQYTPHYTRAVGVTTYGIATTVGIARLYTNHHWASDVMLGAGIGTLAGLAVERHATQRGASQPRALGYFIPSAIMPAPHGTTAITWNWQL